MQLDRQALDAIEIDSVSGELEYGEDGYLRFLPSEDERKKIEAYLHEEITRAIEDHQPLLDEARENLEAYKGVKIPIPVDGSNKSILPSPLVRIPCDQIISSIVNMVLKARPIFSFDAYFPAEYEVPIQVAPAPEAMMNGMAAPGSAQIIKIDAEVLRRRLEQAMDFKARERLDFPRLLWTLVSDLVTTGPVPAWIKVCREKKTRPMVAPKIKGAFVDLTSPKERFYVADGEEVRWYCIPGTNVLMPIDEDDPDTSPWLAERTPLSPTSFLGKFASGEYFLVKDLEEAKKLSLIVSEESPRKAIQESTQNRTPSVPRRTCDVLEVWLTWTLRVEIEDEEGKSQTVVQQFSLMGDYHYGARRLLNLFDNPYEHQRRIHIPFWQFKDPHSHSGTSTAGILKWMQKVHTHCIHADILNAFTVSNPVGGYDPDTSSPELVDHFARYGTQLQPGEMLPGMPGKHWDVRPLAQNSNPLLPTAQHVKGLAQETSNVSAYESGQVIPGRTAASTVAQVLEQGRQQPLLFLRMLNEGMGRVMRLYLRTVRQFQPFGETLPIRDKVTKQVIELPFRLPVGEALDNFRVSLTAAEEALAKEHEPEQIALFLDLWQRHVKFTTEIVAPMLEGKFSPKQMAFLQKAIEGEQALFDEIVAAIRTDEEKFDLAQHVNAMAEEITKIQMQAQMGGMNGTPPNQAPPGGGPVPPGGGPVGGGLPGAVGQPPMGPGGSYPPEAGVPPQGAIQ